MAATSSHLHSISSCSFKAKTADEQSFVEHSSQNTQLPSHPPCALTEAHYSSGHPYQV